MEARIETNAVLQKALKECPWPVDVWPTSIQEAGKWMRERLTDSAVTAISGALMRHGWECAEATVEELLSKHSNEAGAHPLTPDPVSEPHNAEDASKQKEPPLELWAKLRADGQRGFAGIWDFEPWDSDQQKQLGELAKYKLVPVSVQERSESDSAGRAS